MARIRAWTLAAVTAGALTAAARADVVVSSNDGHTVQDSRKLLVAASPVKPDTVTVIDVGRYPPTIKATFEAPGSVVGPPGAIWISRDETWGIVTAATKADPAAFPRTTASRCSI